MIEYPASWTIEREYTDAQGHRREPAAADLDRIVAELGSRGEAARVGVFGLRSTVGVRLVPRNGVGALSWDLKNGIGTVASGASSDGNISLPDGLASGSYALEVDHPDDQQPSTFLVLIAPEQAYQPELGRGWLLTTQLYAVRSARNWGHGDFSDLGDLLEIAAQVGAAGVGLNPLHALPAGSSSPYSPISRIFLNPLYIDVEAIPEFPGVAACGLADEVEQLRAADLIDYARVSAAKYIGLRAAYDAFRTDAGAQSDFAQFLAEQGEALERFAAFEVLTRQFGSHWWDWPEAWRNPQPADMADLRATAAAEIGFHKYLQWRADRQLAACCARAQQRGMPIGLFLDVAIGVEPGGADAWCEQDAMTRGLSIGAPPDLWNPAGQNWGIASLHPQMQIESDFAMLRRTLRAVMRHAGAIRLDHVLGLKRLFLIPRGAVASTGTYVSLPFQAMLAVVAQESQAAQCLVIGEDLGTVPEGFTATLNDWGIWCYRVALFERDHAGAFRNPRDYPERALTSFTTHDLPTFAGWATGHDLVVKAAIGVDPGEDIAARQQAHRHLDAALAEQGLIDGASFAAVSQFLARTPSRLIAIGLEDILGLAHQPNIPATVDEHPNWQRRLPIELGELAAHDGLAAIAAALRAEGRAFAA